MESKKGILGKEIDLYQVIAARRSPKAKPLPKFIMRYLHKTLCIDEVNHIIRESGHLEGPDFLEDVFSRHIKVDFQVENPERFTQVGESRAIFASNHPLGGVDGMLLMLEIEKRYPGRSLMIANDFLMNIKQLASMFIPVNKLSSQSNRDYFKIIQKEFSGDSHIIIFPAGLCSRKFGKTILDLAWHKSFIKRARQFKREVVPLYVDAANTNKFYRLARWRRRLRIKFNIEMMYLVDEMFKQRGKKVRVTVGPAISYTTFDHRYTDWEWAAKLRQYVYELKQNPEATFDPHKAVTLRKTWVG